MATLSIVATPIGNLEDITLRALATLKNVDLILCEDTRTTKRLLERHEVKTPTLSYHAHSKLSKIEKVIGLLKEGKNLALVSDAGTPGISDPGADLVARIRAVFGPGGGYPSVAPFKSDEDLRHFLTSVKIEAIPGPSALTAALSIAGVPCAEFTFLGFLPHKKGRETLFGEIAEAERTTVFYESPHRIMKTLESLDAHLAGLSRQVTVCRELTKIYEEVMAGSPSEVLEYFRLRADKVRGEFVVIVSTG